MKKQIPNFITLLNLMSGCVAVILAVNNQFITASIFVFLGIFFDFFDGFFARKLQVESQLGLQLDSLADLVTSGLVPGVVMFKLIQLSLGNSTTLAETTNWSNSGFFEGLHYEPLAYVGFFITLASAYRLATFNLDDEQQNYFKGLPTPANAIFILSLPLIIEFQNQDWLHHLILNPWFLISITALSCFMLNAPVKLFSLKFKNWRFKSNTLRYLFLVLSLVLLIVGHFSAIPLIIIIYVMLSIISAKTIL